MRTLSIREFDARVVARDSKEALYLHVTDTPAGMPVRQTALVIGGREPGPLLTVVSGIHGDEYEGPLAIMRLFGELTPADVRGTLVCITVSNMPAFEAARRETPSDGRNLNRTFPGDAKGSVTQQIAYWMGERLIRPADACIDLHSGGGNHEIPTLCGYQIGEDAVAQTRRRMAEAFGAPVCLAYITHLPTQAMGFATEHGVPTIFTECPALRCVNLEAAGIYQRGVRNVMRVLGMLDGEIEGGPSEYHFLDPGKPENGVTASVGGFLLPERRTMDQVEAGDLLGVVTDLAGNVLEELRAPIAGYVFLRWWCTTVQAGVGPTFTVVADYVP